MTNFTSVSSSLNTIFTYTTSSISHSGIVVKSLRRIILVTAKMAAEVLN